MHRSGTSAVTRVINLLGARIPGDLLEPLPRNNPTGFWESRDILVLHDELLESVGSSWHDVSAMHSLKGPQTDVACRRLAEIVDPALAENSLVVIKDPRLCRLVPMWLRVLQLVEAEPRFLIWGRHPQEVAESLARRDGFTTEKSLILWLRHVLESEWHTRGFTRAFGQYERLLEDWRRTLTNIAQTLRLTWPRSLDSIEQDVEDFLTPELRHSTAEENWNKSASSAWVRSIDSALRHACEGAPELAVFDEVRQQLESADATLGPELARLLWERDRAEEELHAAKAKSLSRDRELEQIRADAVAKEEKLFALEARVATLEGDNADLTARCAELARVEDELSATTRRFTEHETASRLEVADLREQLEQHRTVLQQVYVSRSWRVTQPLRELMAWCRKTIGGSVDGRRRNCPEDDIGSPGTR